MAVNKHKLLIDPIIRYISHRVNKAGDEPELLPSEMELCDRFKVARGTVRRALALLIQQGLVIRLPKRKGYFSNPAFSRINPYRVIGILVGNGFYTNFGYGSDAVFASFSKNIRDLFCDYHFLSLPMTNTLQQNLQEIKNCLLDALLFIAPDERLIAVADHLINKGFPTVVTGCTWDSSIPALKYNYFGYDFAFGGICRARYFLENHCHKLVYCAQKNVSTESFRRFLNEAGVCFPESNLLQDAEQVGRVLPELLQQDAVDGIVCDGNARRYDQVFKILMASGKKDSVRLLVEDEPQAIVTLSKYPDLKADKIPHVNIVKTSELAGKKAALLLKKILTGKQVRKTEKAVLLK